MKRILSVAAILLLAISCENVNEVEIIEDIHQETISSTIDGNGDMVSKVSFCVPEIEYVSDEETTRAGINNSTTPISFVWEVTDTVGIFPDSGTQVYFSMENGAGTNVASFDGGGWALKQNHTYSCYYPLVGDFYLDRENIPLSFTNQVQRGIEGFNGSRFYLASGGTASEDGNLLFHFNILNTIINVNASLPAGTYTRLLISTTSSAFVKTGTFNINSMEITGKTYSSFLSIDLEDITLESTETIPIFIMSAPVALKGQEVTVKIYTADGKAYTCVKTPSWDYDAGKRYGLTCDFTEQDNDDYVVPEAVDLGLSVKWASFNLGATNQGETGNFYAWGETEPKTSYTQANYKWYDGSSYVKYTSVINLLDLEDDAAFVNLRDGWRMPTKSEIEELVNNCTWTKEEDGYIVTASNGNSIFFPYLEDSYSVGQIIKGYYSSETYDSPSVSYVYPVIGMLGTSTSNVSAGGISISSRYNGALIRPVYDPTVAGLNRNSLNLYLGRSIYLTAKSSSVYDLTWSSDNSSVASVDQDGLVTALNIGSANITASSQDGKFSASCLIEVSEADYSKEYLSFEIVSGGNLCWTEYNGPSSYKKTISYSINDGDWISITSSPSGVIIPVSKGDLIRLKGNNTWYLESYQNISYRSRFSPIYSTCEFNIYGNIMSLIYGDDFEGKTEFRGSAYSYSFGVFDSFFSGLQIIDAGDLVLPATRLAPVCYRGMFSGCSLLTKAPELPATTLDSGSSNWDHSNYKGMFYGCTNLQYIKAMFTDNPGTCTADWVSGVAPTGIFVKNADAEWDIVGPDGVPEGWTVVYETPQDPGRINVQSVSLDKDLLTLATGQTLALNATVIPSNSTNPSIIWSSSDPSVATVDTEGNITGVTVGSAVITVLTKDGNHTATCSVNVRNDIIVFADQLTKSICVGQWDIDHDGEVSFSEAEAVTMIPYGVFNETAITSFDEFQYFTHVTKLEYAREIDEGETDYHGAFGHCSQLKSIVLPSSLHSLSNASFEYCTSLKKITIPVTVTSMGAMVFNGCTNLYVIMDSETPCTLVRDEYETYDSPYTFGTYNQHVKVVYVPTPEAVEAYTANTNANYYWYTCGVPVKWIGEADESLFE